MDSGKTQHTGLIWHSPLDRTVLGQDRSMVMKSDGIESMQFVNGF